MYALSMPLEVEEGVLTDVHGMEGLNVDVPTHE